MSPVMKKDRKSECVSYSSPLPPCKICYAKASGLHYGVNTCEACKGFFRRAIKFQKKYRCFHQQNCDVTGGRSIRTRCPFCRLQKCLNMGMAHNAIKTGRYTHAKRTENILELKRLESDLNVSNFAECELSERNQIIAELATHSMNGEFPMDNKSFPNAKVANNEFCDVQIKQELQDVKNFSDSFYYYDRQQIEPLTLDIHNGFSASHSRIHSELFRIELTRIIACEIDKKLKYEMQISLVKNEQFSAEQGVSWDNVGKTCSMECENQFSPQFTSFPEYLTYEPTIETECEGVYISIPTPPMSSCYSSEDSCFDYSTGPFENPQVVVMSSPSPGNGNIYPSKDVVSSSFLDNSSGFLSPASTSFDSAPSPTSSCTSSSLSSLSSSPGLMVSPFESPGLMSEYSEEDPSFTPNGMKLFHDLSNLVDQDVSVVVNILINAHRKDVITLVEHGHSIIEEKQQKYIEKRMAHAEVFGLTSNYLKDETYKEIFHQTGLDVDGRQEMLFEAGRRLANYLQSLMKFTSNIPGFSSLLPEDQFTLIAAAKQSHWFLNAYLGMNKEQSIILMPNLQTYSLAEVSWLLGSAFIEKCLDTVHQFKKFDLPFEVLVVWKVVLLLSTDDVDLVDSKRVSDLQNIYVNCLLKLTNKFKAERPGLFGHLISLSLNLRELDHVPLTPVLLNESEFDSAVKGHYLSAFS